MSGQSALESDVWPHFKAQPTMSLVISNIAGKNNGPGTYKRRKKAIAGMLKKYQPNIVLFQEFSWKKIRRKSSWKGIDIPDKYEHVGGKGTCILYDKNELNVEIVKEMIIKETLPMGFFPLKICALWKSKQKVFL